MNIGRVVKNKRTARLINMETTNTLGIVGKQVRICEVAQVVRTLPHFYEMREAAYQLHKARCLVMQGSRIMQHHADSAQSIRRQKVGQQLKPDSVIQLQGAKIAIEDQYLVFGPAQDRIAGPTILGFTGE